jgi:hypothetical protein
MATGDFFPQNMATFAVFFPPKKAFVQFALGLFCPPTMRKFATKKHWPEGSIHF